MKTKRGIKRVIDPGKVHNACFNSLGCLPRHGIRL
jgi:hypothetical protein